MTLARDLQYTNAAILVMDADTQALAAMLPHPQQRASDSLEGANLPRDVTDAGLPTAGLGTS